MTVLRGPLLAFALGCAGCTAQPGPLPAVPPPGEARPDVNELPGVPQQREAAFLQAIQPLVGLAPLECNSNLRRGIVVPRGSASPKLLAGWFVCAMNAHAARRPFLVVLERAPFEGWHLTGIAGLADGSIRAFSYVEKCCLSRARELRAGPCHAPTAQRRTTGRFGIRCSNERGSGLVPMPELWLRAQPLPEDLTRRLLALTGDGAVDCGLEYVPSPRGSPGTATDLAGALGCLKRANGSGRPAYVVVHQSSVDSILMRGIVGAATGELQAFAYDSAPCGGPGCAPRFDVRACVRAGIVPRKDHFADFVCVPVTTSPAAPFPRRRAP